jgi:hypothetical protein
MFESRIKQMISSCAAESWESWEEEAVKYLKEKKPQSELNDGAAATALAHTRQPQSSMENAFEIDRGDSDDEPGYENPIDDLNDLTGLQHLFNEFFSSINTVEQYREPNVRACNLTVRPSAASAATDVERLSCRASKCKL